MAQRYAFCQHQDGRMAFEQYEVGPGEWLPHRCFKAGCEPGAAVTPVGGLTAETPYHARAVRREAAWAPPEPTSTDPRDRMTRTERRMADELDADPTVIRWWYESMKLRYGPERAWYTPDFLILRTSGELELREVKRSGRWQTAQKDTRVRFQACAREFPFLRWSWWEWQSSESRWEIVVDYESRLDRPRGPMPS